MEYKEIDGDLIQLALEGNFDVIAHGCNCHSVMGAGLAPQMAKTFGCDKFELEIWGPTIEKLGCIDYETFVLGEKTIWSLEDTNNKHNEPELTVVNAYTQYNYGRNHIDGDKKPLDYEALTLCMRKINRIFKGRHIGLPKIGCGLAGGIWDLKKLPTNTSENLREFVRLTLNNFKDVKTIIQEELKDCKVTIVNYRK